VSVEIPRLARGVRMRVENDDTAFLLVPEGVLELNATARAILLLVDGRRSASDIAEALARQYDASPYQMLDDVNELCASMRIFGFLL